MDGAKADCNFCSFILDSFMTELPSYTRNASLACWFHIHPVFAPRSSASHGDSGLGIYGLDICLRRYSAPLDNVKHGVDTIRFVATADPGTPAITNGDISGLRPLDNPMCDELMTSMNGWLRNCTQNHTACSKTVSGESLDCATVPLPTRCLKINGLSSGVIEARLEETLGKYGRYITLSHRWSQETKSSMTTTNNYEDRKSGKQFDLPQLFKDTLLVAHKLDISYVWIDSICIIQDGNDWESECLKMADYYQQSTLLIAAAINTGDSGLALSTIPSRLLPRLAKLPYRDKFGKGKGYFYLYQSATRLGEAYSKTFEAADLLKRGWVFQEWCLSRRIACFTSPKPGQRIFFHCQTIDPMNEFGAFVPSEHKAHFWGRPIHFADRSLFQLWEHWQLIVETYSNLNLSEVQKDRIIALAGVAKEFRATLHSLAASGQYRNKYTDWCPASQLDADDRFAESYVAGLWFRNIHSGLLWEQRCDEQVVHKRVTGISTWSWASIMIPVTWNNFKDWATCACKLIGVISESGENYTVENESSESSTHTSISGTFNIDNRYATLRLWGRLLPVVIKDNFENETGEVLEVMRLSTPKRNVRKVHLVSKPFFICGWGSFEHPNFQDQDAFTQALYALPISMYTDAWSYLNTRNVIFLRALEDTDSECFERVGVGKIIEEGTDKIFASTPEREIRLC